MQTYQQYLIPLVDHSGNKSGDIGGPLDEEMYLQEVAGGAQDWKAIAKEVRDVYGVDFIYHESQLDPSTCRLLKCPSSTRFRYFVKKGNPSYFVMEHPSLISLHDHLGDPHQKPVLARPSLFARCFGKLDSERQATRFKPGEIGISQHNPDAFSHEIKRLLEKRPSDWHLEPGKHNYHSRLRHNGLLTEPTTLSMSKGKWLINSIIAACDMDSNPVHKPSDGSFVVGGSSTDSVHIRVSMIPSLHGLSLAARAIYPYESEFQTLEGLGMSKESANGLKQLFGQKEGLWLVCGPTGSGKTTTLHALLQLAVQENCKVLAVEDPVERIIPGVQQVEVNSSKGVNFTSALKAFMRQSPDTILVGEIRNRETAEVALLAAFSGHRILATLHARNTDGIVKRFEDFQQQRDWIESAVSIIIHQRLVPLLCDYCKSPLRLSGEVKSLLINHTGINPDDIFSANGCSNCTCGYSSRSGLFAIGTIFNQNNPESAFRKQVLDLLSRGKGDLQGALTYLPQSLRRHLSFPKCKDFAN